MTVGCIAVLFTEARRKILVLQRKDNGRWCLPSGHLEPGESLTAALVREVSEGIGLQVRVERLIGVYSDPDGVLDDGDSRQHPVMLCCRVKAEGGEMKPDEEITEWRYSTEDEIAALPFREDEVQIVADAFANREAAFIR